MKDHELSPADGKLLLGFARSVVQGLLGGKDEFRIPESPVFNRRGAVAVRFLEAGAERVRLAQLAPDKPLGPELKRLVMRAAFDDPGHTPMTESSWQRCELEISFLGKDHRVVSIGEIEPGRDGVIVEMDGHSAWCLPGDGAATRWTREECLTRLCLDAGLPADAWTRPGCCIRVFQSTVIRP
jgi:AMMECR1 domain-containing protein